MSALLDKLQAAPARPVVPILPVDQSPLIDTELIRKYDGPGPRYTSYPTADRFAADYDARSHSRTLRQRAPSSGPLSVYIHLPFCNTICYYCGCNKVVTKNHGRSARYLRYLEKEFALVASQISGSRHVEQVHLGGGTPTFLDADELKALMASLGRHFELLPGEYAIEIDPRTVDDDKIEALAKLGFNRMSLGVQDFNAEVQKAVNRIQSEAETARTMTIARAAGVTSINIDLIYGLPRQTVAGFSLTLDHVLALHPDRIALYSYAHLPILFKPQRRINADELPTAENKLRIMVLAIEKLTAAGYVHIGMDHFALPHDELAVAARSGRLQRNFQGYSTHADSDLLAFGISAISKIGASYSQNVKTLDEYYERLDRGELPVARGIELNANDRLRRAVIRALMCDFKLVIINFEEAWGVDFRRYFAEEWRQLERLAEDGLLSLDACGIEVTPRGRLLVRNVAMMFDRHLAQKEDGGKFSKLI